MEVKCVCKGLSLCSCQWLKGGVVMGVAYCKKVHNFGFTESYKIYCKGWSRAKGQLINCLSKKGGVAVGVACNKKAHNLTKYELMQHGQTL